MRLEVTDAHQTVRSWTAGLKQGIPPAPLQQFLRESFARPPAGWLSRWLSKPYTHEVQGIEMFPDGGFFRTSCLFWVWTRDHFLEAGVLPGGGTRGLFAFGPGGFWYLHGRQDNLEKLFAAEGRSLGDSEPLGLASLLAETLGRDRNRSHSVLKSADHLSNYDGGVGYELNAREWERVRNEVEAPELSGSAASGWQLSFYSVYGWMHEKQLLMRHRYCFGPDFRIERSEEILSRKIFSTTPALRY